MSNRRGRRRCQGFRSVKEELESLCAGWFRSQLTGGQSYCSLHQKCNLVGEVDFDAEVSNYQLEAIRSVRLPELS
jgi:hypothetical protein